MRWRDAAEIDWGTIVLFGTGIIFGSLLADTGLAETIGTSVADALGLTSVVPISIFAVLLAIIVSETTSNTASASVVVPIVIPVAVAAGVNPFVPALAATFAASFLHAAGVDAAERGGLRLRSRADHHDNSIRCDLRHRRCNPDHPVTAADDRRPRAGRMTGHSIAVIPGGIGGEVIASARAVLDTVGARHGIDLDYTEFDWSCQRYERDGAMMPADGIDTLRGFDAILLGAVGWPGVPDHVSLWGLLIDPARFAGTSTCARSGCSRVCRVPFGPPMTLISSSCGRTSRANTARSVAG